MISGFAAPHLPGSGIYQTAGFIRQRAAKKGTVSQNHLTPTTKLPIMKRLRLGDAWALELLLRDLISLGVIWIRPDDKKQWLRVVVDQLATLKADQNF